jgi:hypothetical protein
MATTETTELASPPDEVAVEPRNVKLTCAGEEFTAQLDYETWTLRASYLGTFHVSGLASLEVVKELVRVTAPWIAELRRIHDQAKRLADEIDGAFKTVRSPGGDPDLGPGQYDPPADAGQSEPSF